jgi:single-stranded-DNA-specific exonuclease
LAEATPITFQGLQKRWRVAQPVGLADADTLGDLPPIAAGLLYRHGLRTSRETRVFLEVSESLLEDPLGLPDIDRTVHRLEQAQRRGELVTVYGDFDADGVTGTALMVRGLRRYGITTIQDYAPA